MSTTVELQRLRDTIADRIHAIAQAHYLLGRDGACPQSHDEIAADLIELEGEIRRTSG